MDELGGVRASRVDTRCVLVLVDRVHTRNPLFLGGLCFNGLQLPFRSLECTFGHQGGTFSDALLRHGATMTWQTSFGIINSGCLRRIFHGFRRKIDLYGNEARCK